MMKRSRSRDSIGNGGAARRGAGLAVSRDVRGQGRATGTGRGRTLRGFPGVADRVRSASGRRAEPGRAGRGFRPVAGVERSNATGTESRGMDTMNRAGIEGRTEGGGEVGSGGARTRGEGGDADVSGLGLKWSSEGLIPAIVQDAETGEVLMFAWMNRSALERTLETGETHFHSRSRNAAWHKGGTSGHVQRVREILVDCDADVLLVRAEQVGGACHEGYRSCFSRRLESGGVGSGLRLTRMGERVFAPESVYGSGGVSANLSAGGGSESSGGV